MFINSINVIGAGDFAKAVLTLLEACGTPCSGIYDDDSSLRGKDLWGVPILGPVSDLPDKEGVMAVIAIGSNEARRKISSGFKNITWPVVVHPGSCVHSSVSIKGGTLIFAGAIVQADAKIGRHAIINVGATVDHDADIGDFCNLAPRSCVADRAELGEGVTLGIGSIAAPYTKIAPWTAVGPGSTVERNLNERGYYSGNPATLCKR
jgi:sugar O-acyltransferase (sialic acid O-acetyltransferase NeuD family)